MANPSGRERLAALEQFKQMLFGTQPTVAIYPPTFPSPPDVTARGDEDEDEAALDDEGERHLAIPPKMHFSHGDRFDALVPRLAKSLASAYEKKGKAVFC